MARGKPTGGKQSPVKLKPGTIPSPTQLAPPVNNPKQPRVTISDVKPENFYSPNQPVIPYGLDQIKRPRWWDYQVGYNISYNPRQYEPLSFGMLRAVASSLGVLRALIQTRKDQLARIPWDIRFKKTDSEAKDDLRVQYLKKFLRKPDRQTRWHAWLRLLLDDLLILDAPTIYVEKSVLGIPYALNVVDGATIFPLIDDWGRRPEPPDPAYQQIIKGRPALNLSSDQIIYAPMNLRANHRPYGYSPVEQVYVEIMMSIRRELYQLDYYTEGTIPDLVVTVPKEWTGSQIAEFQSTFDFLLEGNTALKSKVRFLPGDMKPFEIKQPILKNDYDEWLVRILCFAFSISPTAFVRMMNRGTAQTSQEEALEEGLMPLMSWFKDEIMDPVIQEHFGWEDLEFVFTAEEQLDQLKEMQTITGYVDGGILTPDEGRDRIGEAALGADKLVMKTGSGVQLVEDIIAGKTPQQQVPPAPQPGANGPPGAPGAKPGAKAGKPGQNAAAGKGSVKKGLSVGEELEHAHNHNLKALGHIAEARAHLADVRDRIVKSDAGDAADSSARAAAAIGSATQENHHVRKHFMEVGHDTTDADDQHLSLKLAHESHARMARALADGDREAAREHNQETHQHLVNARKSGEKVHEALGGGNVSKLFAESGLKKNFRRIGPLLIRRPARRAQPSAWSTY